MSTDDNHESSSNALVPRSGTGLTETGRRTHPVLARMSRDLLARAEAQGLSTARYRLGKYLFREPDYLQILDWAEALGERPEWVLEQLEESRLEPAEWEELKYFAFFAEDFEPISFTVVDSAIQSLVWDFDRLPVLPDPWQKDMLIHTLGIKGKWPKLKFDEQPEFEHNLNPALPRLRILRCILVDIAQIDLSQSPEIAILQCNGDINRGNKKNYLSFNGLTRLNLASIPKLIELNCSYNSLTMLDLTPTPALTKLNCSYQPLATLDLTPVSSLTTIYCWGNLLTALDLSPVPRLTTLDCRFNQLTELDLTPVPGLTSLYCHRNKLTELNLTPVPGLADLNCDESVRLINPPANLNTTLLDLNN